jgi:hypothetical protein
MLRHYNRYRRRIGYAFEIGEGSVSVDLREKQCGIKVRTVDESATLILSTASQKRKKFY